MEFKEVIKEDFVMVGFSGAGKWTKEVVYPISELWDKAYKSFLTKNPKQIIGVCLPPRSDHYFYTCGIEISSVLYSEIGEGTTVHTFPAQRYVVFKHTGPATMIPNTYGKLWDTFDSNGYKIKPGAPEIEIVNSDMAGQEQSPLYEMEIWIPVESSLNAK
ncbi:GyrI-like domain-containing protein [Priestia megaterium]|uniref:GyrI-like domain-containing protein n=1 Tax=Priestia megaterium TaxID=1404 RepID=UPI00112ED58B|nr:GyrI-like domain-containing protein [Priestia megaterium]TPF19022.1 AraC family transcriptional regulator [Priestia megaterium]TPF23131.1 AraC family transcriptional regulator [Priestia megaterium]